MVVQPSSWILFSFRSSVRMDDALQASALARNSRATRLDGVLLKVQFSSRKLTLKLRSDGFSGGLAERIARQFELQLVLVFCSSPALGH